MTKGHVLYGLLTPKVGQVPTLFGAVEEWLLDRQDERGLSSVTIDWYRQRIQKLLDLAGPDLLVTELQREHVRSLLGAARGAGRADGTLAADFRVFRAFTRWCSRQGWLMDQRLVLMEPPLNRGANEVEIYTTQELAALQRWFQEADPANSLRNVLIHGLLLGTAVRLGELVAIRLEDKHDTQVEIRWQTSKGRATRWPPLSIRLQKDWSRYIRRERPRDAQDSHLLVARGAKPLTRFGVQNLLKSASSATGIHAHAHKYRHTSATLMVRKMLEETGTVDAERWRLVMGHRSLSLLPRYVHLAKSDLLTNWERYAPY